MCRLQSSEEAPQQESLIQSPEERRKLNYEKIVKGYSQHMGCTRTCMEDFNAEISVYGNFTEAVNTNENGRNQMKRELQISHHLHSSIQQDITVPLFYLLSFKHCLVA